MIRRVFDIFDDMAWGLDVWNLPNRLNDFSSIRHYRVYDPEKYELKLKDKFKKQLEESREKEIIRLSELIKETEKQIINLKEEVKQLKG